MNNLDPRDVEKLIGGYATGTLTDSEQRALFAEALRNQALFDALADEEALRELLADPAARRQLLAALSPKRKQAGVLERFAAWFFRPLPMSLAAGVAAAGLAVVIVPRLTDGPKIEQTAVLRETPPVPAPAPQPALETVVSAQPEPSQVPLKLKAKEAAVQPPAAFSAPAAAPPADDSREQERKATAAPARREDAPPAAPAVGSPAAPVAGSSARGAGSAAPSVGTVAAPAAAPPPVAQPQPAPPPPPKEAAAQVASLAKASATAAPFEYSLERQSSGGAWSGIEATARLNAKDQVRVVVQMNAPGLLSIEARGPGNTVRNLFQEAVRAGQRLSVAVPGEGEYRLAMSHLPAQSQPLGAGFRQRAAPAGENRQAKTEASSRDAAGPAPAYSVEIPLRFR